MAMLDEYTLVQMGREYPQSTVSHVVTCMKTMRRLAQRHESLCVRYCNEGDFDPEKINKLEQHIQGTLDALFPGTKVITQRDPRGATVKLLPPSKATNDWGHEGLCVLA